MAQFDDNWNRRSAAVQALAEGWKHDPETLPILKQVAQSDDNPAVRIGAVQELARGWKDDPETLPILQHLAQSDDNSGVRRAAVKELARGWADDPTTLPLLKHLAQSDDNWAVRRAAVEELALGWKDEPGIFEWLGDIAINHSFERQFDSPDYPRQTLLEIMLKQYPDRPKTLVRIQVFDWGIREGMKKSQQWADRASGKKAIALLP